MQALNSYLDIQNAIAASFKAVELLGARGLYAAYDPILSAEEVTSTKSFNQGAVLVAITRVHKVSVNAPRALVHTLGLGVFLIAPKARAQQQADLATGLLFDGVKHVLYNRWEIANAGLPHNLRAQPLSAPELIENKISVWTIEWQQDFILFDQDADGADYPQTALTDQDKRNQALGF